MMGYDHEMLFKKGSTNTVVNALSKKPEGSLYAIFIVTSDML